MIYLIALIVFVLVVIACILSYCAAILTNLQDGQDSTNTLLRDIWARGRK